jgi:DNA processing protein
VTGGSKAPIDSTRCLTLIQARAALHQKRKLFILDRCFRDPTLTWPERLQKQGALRVRDYTEIRAALAP